MLPPFDAWHFGAVGFDVVAAVNGTPRGVRERQRMRLAALLRRARARSPLYRERLGNGQVLPPLAEIEPVTKRELMGRFADWVADPALTAEALRRFAADPGRIGEACPGGHVLWTSSGSSGEPALFVQDARALAVYDALEALRRPPLRTPAQWWAASWGGGERMAFVGATGGHFASTVSIERLRRLSAPMAAALRSFSFLQPMHALAAELEAWPPSVLATYPSTAVALAAEAVSGRLRIAPQEIWTGGETLTAPARAAIEQAFGCKVADSYGASEFLALATECRCKALHFNADWAILEPVDRRYRPVPEGEVGETVLLTNLANHLQPILRYDLGDRVRLRPGRCECGSPLPVIEVQGRSADLLALRDAHHRLVQLTPLALETVLEDQAGVFDFRLEQAGASDLALRVGLRNAQAPAVALERASATLSRYLGAQGLGNVSIAGEVAAVPADPGGKCRRIVALRPPTAAGARTADVTGAGLH